MYQIRKIRSKEEIASCDPFQISYYLWNSKRRPAVSGEMGYIPGEGFFVRMVCGEKEPLALYTAYMDPVCRDSAMEIFLAFPEEGEKLAEGYLKQECGISRLDENTELYCNFYKISETPEIEHYGCFHLIENEKPNFHLPIYFERCQIC